MEMIKKYLSQIIAFLLGFFIAFSFLYFYKNEKKDEEIKQLETAVQEEVASTTEAEEKLVEELNKNSNEAIIAQNASTTDEGSFDYIKVSDQKAGKSIDVAYAKADFPFWLVVHMEKDGKIWNALGARRKEAGEYTGVVVPLLAGTKAGNRYWLVLYKDNGDKMFDLKTDFPVKNKDGKFIMVDFKAL